jgi:hypothetical protein
MCRVEILPAMISSVPIVNGHTGNVAATNAIFELETMLR